MSPYKDGTPTLMEQFDDADASTAYGADEETAAEIARLRAEVERLRGVQPKFPPMPPEGAGLPRYGLRWNGPTAPVAVPLPDGYWTPWHLAAARVETLEAALREICDLCPITSRNLAAFQAGVIARRALG